MPVQDMMFYALVFGIVVVLGFVASQLFGRKTETKLRKRLRENGAAPASQDAQEKEGLTEMLQKIGQAAAKPFEAKTREEQSVRRRRLAMAGIYSPSAQRLLDGIKVILSSAGLVGGYFIGVAMGNMLLGVALCGLAGYLSPVIWLKNRIKKQQKALDRGLADAIDLLVVCVESGLTVDSAMQRVGQEINIAHPSLSREMEIVHMETRVGLARSEALKNLGVRTGSPALQALAAMLIQAERFGTSIASALRVHADSLRVNRQHQAEEIAAKATVKLSFPVVLFIFPAVLIVLAGPACIGLFNSALFDK